MTLINVVPWLITLILLGLGFVLEVWALVTCLRHPAANFPRAGKRTKPFWTLILVAATLIGALCVSQSIAGGGGGLLFGLVAAAAAGIYLADVDPALRQLRGPGRRDRSDGPYGPW